MLVVCDQCQARYKITIARTPGKAVTFKCGKCQHLIRLSPEQIDAGSAPATGVRPATIKPRPEKPAAKPGAEAAAEAETIRGNCLKCGAPYVKPVTDKSTVCYQCRIDSLVNKVREKYGVADAAPEPASAPAAPAPEAAPAENPSRYTIRSADGLVLGPIKFRTVAVLAREKRVSGHEEVARDDGEFAPLMSYPELAELFPNLKEILDTDGLEDKVDEAFMAAFGADEGEGKAAADAAADDEALAGLDGPPPPAPPSPPEDTTPEAEPEPMEEPAADEPSLGLDDLGPDETAATAPPPAPPPAPPAETWEAVEVEHAFKLTDPTGPRPALSPDPAPVTPPVRPEPPSKIVEKSPAQAAPEAKAPALADQPAPKAAAPAAEPALDEGTEFDVGEGEEFDGDAGEDEEIIEDLTPIEPPPDARYRIRYPDGLMLGPVKFGTIKELFKTGNLTGQEEVQRDEAGWAPFTELPELAVLVAEAEPIVEDDVMELTDLLEEK